MKRGLPTLQRYSFRECHSSCYDPGMTRSLDKVLLNPGSSLRFETRDDLLVKLDYLDKRVPARNQGRTTDHREHFCILRYLRRLAGEDLLSLPVTLRKPPKGQDPPDFVLEFDDGSRERFELTDGSTEKYQKRLSAASQTKGPILPIDINTPTKEAAQLWADTLFDAFLAQARGLPKISPSV